MPSKTSAVPFVERVQVDSFAVDPTRARWIAVPWGSGHLRLALFAGAGGLSRSDEYSVYVATSGGAYDYDKSADRFASRLEYDFMPSTGAFDRWIDGYQASWGSKAFAAVALPAMFGSDGPLWLHQDRRIVSVMGAALDALKAKTGAKRLNLAGVSAAGPVLAALAASRSDVSSVTIASAPLDLALELADRRLPRLYTSPGQPIDAMGFASSIARSGARIVLVADPDDLTVSFQHSIRFKHAIEAAGGRAELERARGSGAQHHFLMDWAVGRMMAIDRKNRLAGETR